MSTPDKSQPTAIQPEPLTSELRIGGGSYLPWILLALLVAAVVGSFATGLWEMRLSIDTPEGHRRMLQEQATTNAELGRKADSERNKIDWRDAEQDLSKTGDKLRKSKDAAQDLSQLLDNLLTDETGKLIAGSAASLDQFIAIQEASRPSSAEIDVKLQGVDSLLSLCQEAISNDKVVIPCDKNFVAKVLELQTEADLAHQAIDEPLALLRSLASGVAANTPSNQPLREAVKAEVERRDAERLSQWTQAQEQLQTELRRAKDQQSLDTERKLQEANAAKQHAEDALKVAEAQAASQQAKEIVATAQQMLAVEQARLKRLVEFERATPEIHSLLAPMISVGTMQLGRSGWEQGERGPLSYTALMETPAFRRINDESWRNLGAMFCGPSCPNDRPRGSFPSSMTYHERELQRAVELVSLYGELMVEKQLLRP